MTNKPEPVGKCYSSCYSHGTYSEEEIAAILRSEMVGK